MRHEPKSNTLSGLTIATCFRPYTFTVASTFSAATFVTGTDRAANANGQWGIQAHLAEGESSVWAEAWDLAGNHSAPSAVAVRVLDTVSPTVGLEARSFVQAGDGLTASVLISDTSPIAQALLTLPDVAGTGEMALAERDGVWEATYYLPQGTAEGGHTALVRAWDAAGNVG